MQGNSGMKGNKMAGYDIGQMQNFTPEQMQLFQTMFGNVGAGSNTARLARGDQSMFEEMEAPAMRQFGQLQGQNASRFSGMGMGARKGSGFQNTMNQASSDFAQDLQSRRMGLMRQATQDLHGMSNDLLNQRPFENYMVRPKPKNSFMNSVIGGALPIAGAAFGMTPWGAATGGPATWGAIGSAAGQGFTQTDYGDEGY